MVSHLLNYFQAYRSVFINYRLFVIFYFKNHVFFAVLDSLIHFFEADVVFFQFIVHTVYVLSLGIEVEEHGVVFIFGKIGDEHNITFLIQILRGWMC